MPQPFVPLSDGAQVEIIFMLFGEVVENRLWFITRQPPITSLQLQNLVIGVASWHIAQVLPHLSQDIVLTQIRGRDWTDTPPPFEINGFTAVAGGVLDAAHSANVSYRVAFKGDNSQTFKNNSNFIPGIPQSAVAENTMDSGFLTAIRNAYINLIDLAAGFGPFPAWRWVITSNYAGGAYRTLQEHARTDFIRTPSPYVSPRRKRLP